MKIANGPVSGCAVLLGVLLVAGCSSAPTEEDKIQAAAVTLSYERDGIVRLKEMAKTSANFTERQDDGVTEPAEFTRQLEDTLSNLKSVQHAGEHQATIDTLVAKLDEIRQLSPKKPSPELTTKLDEAIALADKLPGREAD